MPEPCCLEAVPRGLELGGVGSPDRSEMSEAGFTRLESERLILRRFKASDLAPFLAYRNDPEVARYQTWDSYTEREAAAMIEELGSLQPRSEEHTSELQSRQYLVCRLLLEKKI